MPHCGKTPKGRKGSLLPSSPVKFTSRRGEKIPIPEQVYKFMKRRKTKCTVFENVGEKKVTVAESREAYLERRAVHLSYLKDDRWTVTMKDGTTKECTFEEGLELLLKSL